MLARTFQSIPFRAPWFETRQLPHRWKALSCLLSAVTLLTWPSDAATLTWTGAAGDGLIASAGNWSPAQSPASGDVLIFAGGQGLAPQLTSSLSVGSITFNSTAQAFILSGTGTYTVGTAGITNSSSATETIANSLQLGAAQSWKANSGALIISGAVNNAGFVLTSGGTNALTISGPISGTGGITQAGSGSLLLSGANSYSGTTTLTAGTLIVGSNTALGTGTFAFGKGGQLQASGGARTVSNGVNLGGNVVFSGVNDLAFGGAVSLAANRTITVNGSGILAFNGPIAKSGNRKLTKAGTGTLAMNGANAFSGGLILSAGTLILGNDAAAGTGTLTLSTGTLQAGNGARTIGNALSLTGNTTFGGTNDLTFTGGAALTGARTLSVTSANATFSGILSGNFALSKSGAGTLVLSGNSANTFNGGLNVNDGTVVLAKGAGKNAFAGNLSVGDSTGAANSAIAILNASNQIPDTSTVVLRPDGVLNVQTFTDTVASITTTGGRITGSTGRLDLAGNLTSSASGAAVTMIDAALGLTASRTFQVNDNAVTTDMDVAVTGVISGTGFSLTKSGTGTLLLGGANVYTGGTNILAGTLVLDASSSGAITNGPLGTGSINLGDTTGTAAASLIFSTSAGRSVANAISVRTVTTGALALGGANTSGVNTFAGNLTLNASAALTAASGGEVNFSGVLSGAGGITTTGGGTVRLSNVNTFTGAVTIDAGTLAYGVSNALANNTVTISGGNLDLGANRTDTVGTVLLTSGAIIGSGASVLTSTSGFTAESGSIAVAMAGNIGFTKNTAGTVVLSGVNTYTGPTAINAGTLTLGVAQSLSAASAVTIASGSTLDLAGFDQTVGSLAGAGSLALGAGRLTVGGSNGSTSFIGSISGAGGLTKTGAGVFTSGANSLYSGATNVLAGTFRLSAASGIPTNSAVTVSSGATLDLAGISATVGSMAGAGTVTLGAGTLTAGGDASSTIFSGAINGTGGFTKAGSGNFTVDGANGFSGAVTVNSGTLTLSGANGTMASAASVALLPGSQLVLDNSAGVNANRLSDSAAVQFRGGELRLNTGTGASMETLGALNVLAGDSKITLVFNTAVGLTSSLVFSSLGTVGTGATLNFSSIGATLGAGTAGARIFITGQPTGLIGSWARVGTDFADYTLNGITAFTGYYTGSDGINVNDATRIVQLSSAAPSSAYTLTRTGITTDRSLRLLDAPLVDLSSDATRTLVLADGGIIKSGAPATTISGAASLTAGTTTVGALSIAVESTRTLTIATPIIDNAGPDGLFGTSDDKPVSVSKDDLGTLVLSGSNRYAGGNFINGGTLQVAADTALGAAQNDVAFSGGTLRVTSSFQSNIGRVFSVTAGLSGALSIDAGQTLTIGGASGLVTTADTAATLIANGAGTVVLLDANAGLTGTLQVTAGNLELRNPASAGSARISLGGGTLRLRADSSNTYPNSITVTADAAIEAARLTGTVPGVTLALGSMSIGAQTLTLSATNGATLVLGDTALTGAATFSTSSGTTRIGAISGAFGFTKAGSGTLELAASGTFTGSTTISGGTLRLSVVDGITQTSSVSVASGATLDASNLSPSLASLAGSGSVVLGTGSITMGNTGASSTFSGTISGSGGLTKSGAGTFILAGPNTYSGPTSINGGTLQANVAGALFGSTEVTVASGATFSLNGFDQSVGSLAGNGLVLLGSGTLTTGNNGNSTTFSGAINGTGGLTKTGSGTLTLDGTSTFTGTVRVNAGTLNVASAAALGASSGGTTVQSGAEVTLADGIAISNEPLSLAGSGPAGGGALRLPGGAASWIGGINLAGDATIGATLGQFTIDGTVALGGYQLALTGNGETDVPAVISGSGAITKAGTGPLLLLGANTFSGLTQVAAGELHLRHDSALGASGALNGTIVQNGASIVFDSPAGVTIAGESLNVGGGGYGGLGALAATAGDSEWAGPITLTANTTVNVSGSNTLTLSGAIGELASGRGLSKIGTGTLILGGASSFTGTLSIDAGFVQLATDERVDDSAPVVIAAGAVLDLADSSETVGAIGGSGEIRLGIDGTALFTVGYGGASSLFPGAITGAGDLAKLGSGTLSLTGPNTFTGNVTIAEGRLAIDAESRLGTGTLLLDGGGLTALADFTLARGVNIGSAGGTLDTNNHVLTVSGAVSGANALLKTGAGNLILSGNSSSFAGNLIVEAGIATVLGSLGSTPALIEGGSALAGTGTVGDTTALSGGSIAPGNNVGQLTSGALDLQTGAHLAIEIGGLTVGTQYDQLKVNGSVNLAGDLQVTFVNGFTPKAGDKFFILLNDGSDAITGRFSNVLNNLLTLPNAIFSVSLTDNGDAGSLGNDASITYVSAPEPSSLASLAAACLLIGARRRSRRASGN